LQGLSRELKKTRTKEEKEIELKEIREKAKRAQEFLNRNNDLHLKLKNEAKKIEEEKKKKLEEYKKRKECNKK
jgi:hypothetical protein